MNQSEKIKNKKPAEKELQQDPKAPETSFNEESDPTSLIQTLMVAGVEDLQEILRSQIKKNPYLLLGSAAFVGYTLGNISCHKKMSSFLLRNLLKKLGRVGLRFALHKILTYLLKSSVLERSNRKKSTDSQTT